MRQSQLGRTLIETLSILALIGILSVSGLQLYAKAMNTIRANYLMQQVFIKANELIQNPVAYRHKMVDVTVTDENTGNLAYGYSFCKEGGCAPKIESGEIQVQIRGYFPVGLCKILKKKLLAQEYQGLKNIKADNLGLGNGDHQDCPKDAPIESMTFIIDPAFKE